MALNIKAFMGPKTVMDSISNIVQIRPAKVEAINPKGLSYDNDKDILKNSDRKKNVQSETQEKNSTITKYLNIFSIR